MAACPGPWLTSPGKKVHERPTSPTIYQVFVSHIRDVRQPYTRLLSLQRYSCYKLVAVKQAKPSTQLAHLHCIALLLHVTLSLTPLPVLVLVHLSLSFPPHTVRPHLRLYPPRLVHRSVAAASRCCTVWNSLPQRGELQQRAEARGPQIGVTEEPTLQVCWGCQAGGWPQGPC